LSCRLANLELKAFSSPKLSEDDGGGVVAGPQQLNSSHRRDVRSFLYSCYFATPFKKCTVNTGWPIQKQCSKKLFLNGSSGSIGSLAMFSNLILLKKKKSYIVVSRYL